MVLSDRRAQVSSIEILFALMLFGTYVFYISDNSVETQRDYAKSIDSALDSIYNNDNYRNIMMGEDLSKSINTRDWNPLLTVLDNSYSSYELVISNSTNQKTIISCSDGYNKYLSQRVIAVNSSDYQFRKIRLGVCY